MRLKGKRVVITGGTSGIGRAAVVACAREGASVVFTGRSSGGARDTLDAAKDSANRIRFVEHDVTDEGQWQTVFNAANDSMGGVDVVVNNAGIFFADPLPDTTPERFQSMWRVNVDGVFLGTKLGAEALSRNQDGGSIVNVASLSGLVGHEYCSAYCSTKAAAIMLTKSAAVELAPKIRVNALAPGPIWNELLQSAHRDDDAEQMRQYYRDTSPMKILGQSEDVANAIVYLASDESRAVNGAVLRVDAGRGSD